MNTRVSVLKPYEREALLALCDRRKAKFGGKFRVRRFHIHRSSKSCEQRGYLVAADRKPHSIGADSTHGESA